MADSLSVATHFRGVLVSDIDGTLALRGRCLSSAAVAAVRQIAGAGWQVVLVSGQGIANLADRVAPLQRTLTTVPFTLYTCEGACRWHCINRRLLEDRQFSIRHRFSARQRRRIEALLAMGWASVARREPISVIASPEWWEKVVLAIKIRADTTSRIRIAADLQSWLNDKLIETRNGIRVRAAAVGKTTIIIAPMGVDKALALRDIRASQPSSVCVIYIGDEFTHAGNDRVVLGVEGVINIAAGGCQEVLPAGLLRIGEGPNSTVRFLRILANVSARTDPRTAVATSIAELGAP